MLRVGASISGNPIEAMIARLVDIRPALRSWLEMRRELVSREFSQEGWLPPSGASVSWQRTAAFGDRSAPPKTLQRSGALLRAYLGQGTGSIEEIAARAATFGVSGSTFPYASVHRGGAGKVNAAASRVPFLIPVTDRMRGFLAANFGVRMRATTRNITIVRRPHATESVESRTRRAAIFSRFVRGLALEAGRGAR